MNRTLAILLAAIVAVASGLGLFLYVSSVDERAAADEELVAAYMVRESIGVSTRFETSFNEGIIEKVSVPARLVPPTAVTDPNELIGFVARNDIPAGQFVVDDLFVDPSLDEDADVPDTFARRIPDGRVAITFSAGRQAAVAELIQPGDMVNLLIEVEDPAQLGLTEPGPAVVHVFQNLEILAIGQVAANTEGPEAPANPGGGLYTVLVAPDDAARLILLTNQYEVFLALVPPTNEPEDLPPVISIDALPKGRTPDESATR